MCRELNTFVNPKILITKSSKNRHWGEAEMHRHAAELERKIIIDIAKSKFRMKQAQRSYTKSRTINVGLHPYKEDHYRRAFLTVQ